MPLAGWSALSQQAGLDAQHEHLRLLYTSFKKDWQGDIHIISKDWRGDILPLSPGSLWRPGACGKLPSRAEKGFMYGMICLIIISGCSIELVLASTSSCLVRNAHSQSNNLNKPPSARNLGISVTATHPPPLCQRMSFLVLTEVLTAPCEPTWHANTTRWALPPP